MSGPTDPPTTPKVDTQKDSFSFGALRHTFTLPFHEYTHGTKAHFYIPRSQSLAMVIVGDETSCLSAGAVRDTHVP